MNDDVFIWAPPNAGQWKKTMRICSDCGRVFNVDDPLSHQKTHLNKYGKPCFSDPRTVTMNNVKRKDGTEVELTDD
jgi:hypothetical protein